MTNLLLAGLLAVVAATQSPASPQTGGPTADTRRVAPNGGVFFPFVPLHAPPAPVAAATQPPVSKPGAVKEVFPKGDLPERGACNMPVIRANPNVDPRIIVPIPDDLGAKIRVIEPHQCWEAAK